MNHQEYLDKLSKIDKERNEKALNLVRSYAIEYDKVKVGDFLTNKKGLCMRVKFIDFLYDKDLVGPPVVKFSGPRMNIRFMPTSSFLNFLDHEVTRLLPKEAWTPVVGDKQHPLVNMNKEVLFNHNH